MALSMSFTSLPESVPPKQAVTPMLQQYLTIKQAHKDHLLFFRLGDFYELFFEDAVIASSILDITLTKRGHQQGEEIPMCGVPFHAADSYIGKLIRSGQKIAICEQQETPEEAKKRGHKAIVRREVVRVITPGTVLEEHLLESGAHNYLMSIALHGKSLAVGMIDISTGDFFTQSLSVPEALMGILLSYQPKEIVVPQAITHQPLLYQQLHEWKRFLTVQPDNRFVLGTARALLEKQYGVSQFEGFGQFSEAEICAAGALLNYVYLTQCGQCPPLKPFRSLQTSDFLRIDGQTQRNLELFQTLSGEKQGSFLAAIDRTHTAGGKRLLRQWLMRPERSIFEIQLRQKEVQTLLSVPLNGQESLVAGLRHMPDMERVLGRILSGRGGPRDLLSLRQGLHMISELVQLQRALFPAQFLHTLNKELDDAQQLREGLDAALKDEVPVLAREGNFVKRGYSQDLDHIILLRDEGKNAISVLQQAYIQETGINTLKIKHNNVLGYFVEITALHKDKMPESLFLHRQTLANAMRYTTTELAKLEQDLVVAADEALALEQQIFSALVHQVSHMQTSLYVLAYRVSYLDVIVGFATLARTQNYVCPEITAGLEFEIKEGRHPVVEQALNTDAPFVANSCSLGRQNYLWLVTGPNMAGKSTFLRQNALLVIMAQMGSYVPAAAATIGLVDRIFSRVGAADDLARGQSTFMVEMIETAAILNQATEHSFVILDEVGRGTATHDGMAIAWAVVEYLLQIIKARGLFATHYHELAQLCDTFTMLKPYTMAVKEWENTILFLHKIIPGRADKSYGLHVAALAGLPLTVRERAQEILDSIQIENKIRTK